MSGTTPIVTGRMVGGVPAAATTAAATTAAAVGPGRRGIVPVGEPAGAALLRQHARTFHLAARLLPREVRHDLATLYGFCRRVDDAVDEADGPGAARRRLAAVLDPRGDDPVTTEFHRLAAERGIPAEVVEALVEGVRSDLGPVRIELERDLIRYAHRVAGTVGLMICAVLRVPERSHAHAIDLGIGMQLTNIARDVAEDARRDRVYVPGEWVGPQDVLAAVRAASGGGGGGVQDDAAAGGSATERTQAAVTRLLDRAARHYRSADAGMIDLPPAVRPGILAASRNYEAIGTRVRRDGVRALGRRTRIGRPGKVLGILRALATTGRIVAAGPRSFRPHEADLHRHLDGLPCRIMEAVR